MTAHHATSAPAAQPPAGELRLIVRDTPLTLAEHLDRYGPPPIGYLGAGVEAGNLITEVERSGLTGRGGASFPAGRKIRAVADAAQGAGPVRNAAGPVIVANGSESEPASHKDFVLLARAPHLVLDGVAMCAAAIGATKAYLCVGHDSATTTGQLRQAIMQRDSAGLNRIPIQVKAVPQAYLSGQETALISVLNGGTPLPTFMPPRPAQRGAHRRPTLVLNVETLAHIALIGRFGSRWFRSLGTADAPGTALITLGGPVARPGVREVPLGTALGEVLDRSGLVSPPQAVLAGGYFGTWLALPSGMRVPISHDGMRAAGATLGPGVLIVLPQSACGLAETARISAFLARQAAGQCGPCKNGLPALADALNWLAFGPPGGDLLAHVRQLTSLISGRGACHLPDGAAALITSALEVFGADVRAHLHAGPCPYASAPPVLPIPSWPSL